MMRHGLACDGAADTTNNAATIIATRPMTPSFEGARNREKLGLSQYVFLRSERNIGEQIRNDRSADAVSERKKRESDQKSM
jgi:hypothetical protein